MGKFLTLGPPVEEGAADVEKLGQVARGEAPAPDQSPLAPEMTPPADPKAPWNKPFAEFREGANRMAADLHGFADKHGDKLTPAARALLHSAATGLEFTPVGSSAGETAAMLPLEGGKPSPKNIIEDAGLKYKGELVKGSQVHMFEHPDHPGQTAALHESKITPESVKAKMAEKTAEFEAGKLEAARTAKTQPKLGPGKDFYSTLEHVIETKLPEKFSGQQLMSTLQNAGVSKREIEHARVHEFAGAATLDKSTVLGAAKERTPHVETIENGAESNEAIKDAYAQHIKFSENLKTSLRSKLGLSDQKANNAIADLKATMWLNGKVTANSLVKELENNGVGTEARGWAQEHLNEVQNLVDSHHEVNYFKNNSNTKYESYTLPGGENYREVLLQLPSKEPRAKSADPYERRAARVEGEDYQGPHFDEPNVVAHLRLKDRTDVNGKKTLFIEELQSDWARELREQQSKGGLNYDPEKGANARTPDMPFDKSWHELALKKALHLAATEGYDQVAWTTGKQQAERYNLRNYFDKLGLREEDGKLQLLTKRADAKFVSPDDYGSIVPVTRENLSQYVGNDHAKTLLEQLDKKELASGWDPLGIVGHYRDKYRESSIDLKDKPLAMGGEHHLRLYDEMVPQFLNRHTKKWGGQVGETEIKMPAKGHPSDAKNFQPPSLSKVQSLPITPELREGIKRGQPLLGADKLDFSSIPGHQEHEIASQAETPKPSARELADVKSKTGLPLTDEAAQRRIKERAAISQEGTTVPKTGMEAGPQPSRAELDAVRKDTGLPLTDEAAAKRVRERTAGDKLSGKTTLEGKQGGHAGGDVSSEEELARPGRFVKINQSGIPTDQGKTPDFNLKAGEAGYQVKPDGTYELKAGQETSATKRGVEGYTKELHGNKAQEKLSGKQKLKPINFTARSGGSAPTDRNRMVIEGIDEPKSNPEGRFADRVKIDPFAKGYKGYKRGPKESLTRT